MEHDDIHDTMKSESGPIVALHLHLGKTIALRNMENIQLSLDPRMRFNREDE